MRNIFMKKESISDNLIYITYVGVFHYKRAGQISLLKLFDRWAIYKSVGDLRCMFGFVWGR